MQKAAATTTTTTTSAVITGFWQADMGACATASYAFSKNGSSIASGGGAASGSFTCVVGDVVEAQMISGIKGIACNNAFASVDRNGVTVASQSVSGFNQIATATWTVTAGTTSVTLNSGLVA